MTNPYTSMAALADAGVLDGEGAELGAVFGLARDLWATFEALPSKPEAILAQRRLQEAVFWAGQSHGGVRLRTLDAIVAAGQEAGQL